MGQNTPFEIDLHTSGRRASVIDAHWRGHPERVMLLVDLPFVPAQFPRGCGLQCPRVSPGAKLPPGSRPVSRMLRLRVGQSAAPGRSADGAALLSQGGGEESNSAPSNH